MTERALWVVELEWPKGWKPTLRVYGSEKNAKNGLAHLANLHRQLEMEARITKYQPLPVEKLTKILYHAERENDGSQGMVAVIDGLRELLGMESTEEEEANEQRTIDRGLGQIPV